MRGYYTSVFLFVEGTGGGIVFANKQDRTLDPLKLPHEWFCGWNNPLERPHHKRLVLTMMIMMMPLTFISSLTLTLGSVEKDLQGLNIGGLGDITGNITSKLPTQEDAEKVFAEKCRKNGGEEAYVKAQKAKEEALECVKGLVNFEELQKEMEIAKPSGDLDTVFKKYCRKSPDLVACVEKFTTEFEPCLEEEERKSKNIVLNVTSHLIEFICHKEGDRIALFIAEGGPECLNASEKGITECFQTIFKKDLPDNNDFGLSNLPVLLFQEEQCSDFSKLQKCVVKELEKCKEPTPANVIDSLFNYVRKVTPCLKLEEAARKSDHNGISSPYISPFAVLALTVTNVFIFINFF